MLSENIMAAVYVLGRVIGTLSVSNDMTVKYSVKGGTFYAEFLGIITSICAALAGIYVIYREKSAVAKHIVNN